MNKQQIEFIRSLDPEGIDGTIQVFLLHEEINHIPFETAAKKILERLMNEKRSLVKDNIRLSRLVKDFDD